MNEIKEIWKPIKNHENKYMVSNLGRFKRIPHYIDRGAKGVINYSERIVKPWIHKQGWLHIELDGVTYGAHRLVLSAFVENKENKNTVNHINGIKTDNRLVNLEWATNRENSSHAAKMGLYRPVRGVLNHNAKLLEADVKEIRRLHGNGVSQRELGRRYNVDHVSIKNILIKKTWAHV